MPIAQAGPRRRSAMRARQVPEKFAAYVSMQKILKRAYAQKPGAL
jgi:hypothetical protein